MVSGELLAQVVCFLGPSVKDPRSVAAGGWLRRLPVEFLTDDQADASGKFVEEPTCPELERCFSLDDVDRDLIALRRTQHHHLGFALQMCARCATSAGSSPTIR